MLDITYQTGENYGMSAKRRKRNDALAVEIGRRIEVLMGDSKRKDIAEQIGIAPSTLWDYMRGDAIPGPEVLIKMADVFHVSLDYILKGDCSSFPKNEAEKNILYEYREAEKLQVAEQISRYGRFLINEAKKQTGTGIREGKSVRHKNSSR